MIQQSCLKVILPLIIYAGVLVGCRSVPPQDEFGNSGVNAASSEADVLAAAAKEFEDLQLSLDLGYLGTVKKSNPSPAFLSAAEISSFETEMKKSLKGSGRLLNFVYCESRGFFPRTTVAKECDYVIDGKETVFEFKFAAINPKNGQSCYLSESCRIHQVVSVLAKNDGIQRPPVFIFKEPVKNLMMLYTNRIFHSNRLGPNNFLRRWTESQEFAALVVSPYNFSKNYGESLARMLGDCKGQFMNLVHFSNEALKIYKNRKKPVAITSVVANAAMLTGMIYLGAGSLAKLKGGIAALRGGAGLSMKGLSPGKAAYYALDYIDDVSAIPYVLSEVGNWRDHVKQHRPGSPQHRAIQTALFLANFGDVAGATAVGLIGVKHLKAATKTLGVLAGVGVASVGLSNTQGGKAVFNGIRHGNISEVRHSLCQLQIEQGFRKACSPVRQVTAQACSSNIF